MAQLASDKSIKLNGIGLKYNTNLYQIKFRFTGGIESRTFNSQTGATLDPKIYDISVIKNICAVEINVRETENNIYGIRFLDSNGNKVQERQWRRSNNASWTRIEIPPGMEIIGFHGSHDGNYIKQLGLILWIPNPAAQTMIN